MILFIEIFYYHLAFRLVDYLLLNFTIKIKLNKESHRESLRVGPNPMIQAYANPHEDRDSVRIKKNLLAQLYYNILE